MMLSVTVLNVVMLSVAAPSNRHNSNDGYFKTLCSGKAVYPEAEPEAAGADSRWDFLAPPTSRRTKSRPVRRHRRPLPAERWPTWGGCCSGDGGGVDGRADPDVTKLLRTQFTSVCNKLDIIGMIFRMMENISEFN